MRLRATTKALLGLVRTPTESLFMSFKPSILGWLFCCPTATTKALWVLGSNPNGITFMSFKPSILGWLFCCPTATTKALLGLVRTPTESLVNTWNFLILKGVPFFVIVLGEKNISPKSYYLCVICWLTPSKIERWNIRSLAEWMLSAKLVHPN